ncbi:MAG: hypothetical protein WHT47_02265 [Hydrogenothermaceae bacterium]
MSLALENPFKSEIEALSEKSKKIIEDLYELYKSNYDEDLIETYVISLYSKYYKFKDVLRDMMSDAITQLNIPKKDKEIFKEILDEAYFSLKLREKIDQDQEFKCIIEKVVNNEIYKL